MTTLSMRCIYIAWFARNCTWRTRSTAGFAILLSGRGERSLTWCEKPSLGHLVRAISTSAFLPSRGSLPYGTTVATSATPPRT